MKFASDYVSADAFEELSNLLWEVDNPKADIDLALGRFGSEVPLDE